MVKIGVSDKNVVDKAKIPSMEAKCVYGKAKYDDTKHREGDRSQLA